jgi:DNA topoisomerase-1
VGGNGQAEVEAASGDRLLGTDPGTGEEVWLKIGRFGPYVQLGSGKEAKRSSLPPGTGPEQVGLELAVNLLSLPRQVGADPETRQPILAGINRFGPYIQRDKTYVRLEPGDDVFTIGMNRALALLAEPPKGRRAAAAAGPLREVGPHPEDQEPITVHAGRFGPYVKHGKLNASLPKGVTPETLAVEQAVQLLVQRAEKVAQGGGKPPARGGRGKAPVAAKKPAKATKASGEADKTAKKAGTTSARGAGKTGGAARAAAPKAKPAARKNS